MPICIACIAIIGFIIGIPIDVGGNIPQGIMEPEGSWEGWGRGEGCGT